MRTSFRESDVPVLDGHEPGWAGAEMENMSEPDRGNFPETAFHPMDFRCFEQRRRRDREHNQYRLRVKRKLASLGELLLKPLREQGLAVVSQTSLHHPYTYNKYSVDSQWVYFSPDPEASRFLKEKLGPVGEDLDTHYIHALLLVGIEEAGLFVSLKIHPQAWWEGQNLKNKCRRAEARSELVKLLRPLDGFSLRLHDWPNTHPCSRIDADTVSRYFEYYTPGEHWFHLDLRIPKEEPVATEPRFAEFAERQLVSLMPVYSFIRWTPQNNHVFR